MNERFTGLHSDIETQFSLSYNGFERTENNLQGIRELVQEVRNRAIVLIKHDRVRCVYCHHVTYIYEANL